VLRPSFLLVAAFFVSACGPVTFVTELKGEGVVPGSALGGLLSAFPSLGALAAINFDENQDFKNNDATKDRVSSLVVESFSLHIVEPADQDFSFLDNVDVIAKGGDVEVLAASKSGIAQLNLPPPNPTLVFDPSNKDLVSVLAAPTVSVVMRGKGRQPPKDTRLEAKAKIRVGLKF
jgi:hypothetical protein